MIRLSAIVVLLTVGAPLDVRAGDVAAYAALVHLYRSGGGQDATRQLAAWPRKDVSSAVKAAAAAWTPAERMVAAILHAHAANVLLDARPDDAAFLVDTGYALVQAAGPAPFGAERGDVTPRRWYYVVASRLISAARIDGPAGAVRIVHKARLAFPRDANLLFVRGTLIEMRIQTLGSVTGLRNELPDSPGDRQRFDRIAKGAVDDDDRALNINPTSPSRNCTSAGCGCFSAIAAAHGRRSRPPWPPPTRSPCGISRIYF